MLGRDVLDAACASYFVDTTPAPPEAAPRRRRRALEHVA
jgi:hypothetical protein